MTVSQPAVNINIRPGIDEIENEEQRVLLIGQKTAAGSAAAEVLVENIGSDLAENGLFGENSILAEMVRNLKAVNKVTRVDAIPIDDGGGSVSATATVTFTGPATEDGSLSVDVGSRENYRFELSILDTDSATVVGDKLEAAINANTACPVTAANVAGVVTLTAVNKGEVGNKIGLAFSGAVAGVGVVLVGFSGGTGDVFPTTIFDQIASVRYQTVVANFELINTGDLADGITDFLDPRFNSDNDILDGVGIIPLTDSFANLTTIADANDSSSLVFLINQSVDNADYKAGEILELDHARAAQFAGNRALRLTDGANISDIVAASVGTLDTIGGKEIASLPYSNTPFPALPLIDIGKESTKIEVESLKDDGGSYLGNNVARNSIIADEIVTTYKTATGSIPDTTFKFLNSVDTSSVVREFFFNNAKARFAQTRLTSGALVANRAIANEGVIRDFLKQMYTSLAGVLTQAGEDQLNFFIQNLDVTVDGANGSAVASMKTPLVTQLRDLTADMKIVF